MELVADLHLHSKYSRAVSQQMVLPIMAQWAAVKGINLLGTGDFTHPLWFREIKGLLEEENGVFKLKGEEKKGVRFLLTTEISSIYRQGDRTRKIHNVIIASSLAAAEKINQELAKRGFNLMSDGRPIIGFPAKDLLDLVMTVDENNLLIPAHIWTPHFSLFGSESGFDALEECFGGLSPQVRAVETGLSSDPAMNWRIPDLAHRQIVSFSDAHSPENLGRELTILEVSELSYKNIRSALIGDNGRGISSTVEFYPEEGKYHFTGHRACGVSQSPQETAKRGATCPVCGKPLTIGVMHRVEELAKIPVAAETSSDEFGVRWLATAERPAYATLVPLREILAEVEEVGKASQKVVNVYQQLAEKLGSELAILLKTPVEKIASVGGEKLADAVGKVRSGQIFIKPGFDGEYGLVKIWDEGLVQEKGPKEQMSLF
jgi:uncharacterized protein (TIGR00375 family)